MTDELSSRSRRLPQVLVAGAILTAGLLVLPGALSGGDSHSTSGTAKSGPQRTSLDKSASRVFGAPSLAAPAPAAVGVTGATSSEVSVQDEPRIVKTGTLSLVVDDGKVSATVTRLQAIVAGLRGFVSNSESSEAGEHPAATITVRVPVASFEELVKQVRELKVKVVSAQTSGQDVTATYADTQAQIRTLTAARARYLVILGGAKTIAEILTVQQRIDDVQGQIDRLEGQRRVLADQSDLATLTISVADRTDQVLTTAPRSGWSKAWHDATDGFTSGVQGILARSGRALLVLLVVGVVLLLTRFGWRRARREVG